MMILRIFSLLFLLAGSTQVRAEPAPWVGVALNGAACTGGSPGNFGPYDYITNTDKLPVVERRHFTIQVEQLVKGETAPHPMGDVSYTLVRFPNHHRALYSAIRYSLGEVPKSTREDYYAECFLQRAINFSPADPVPRMLFGLYLHRLGRLPSAIEHYQIAEQMAPNDPNLLYNYGLALFDAGRYEEANLYAGKAYTLGVEFPALKRKLKNAGYWQQ